MAKANTPPADDRPDRDLLDDPDLIEFTERLPEARKVSIKAMSESGNWKHKGSMTIDSFNLDNVQRRYGGGTYRFSYHGADGRLLKTISNIEIDDVEDDDREVRTVATAQAVSPSVGSNLEDMLKLQLAQQQTMMLEMIRAIGNAKQQQQTPITEMITALATLQGMMPKQPPEVQTMALNAIEKGIELAAKMHGRVGGGDVTPMGEFLGLVRDVFKEAQPLIMDLLKTPAAKPAKPAIPGKLEGPDDEEEEDGLDLTPALQFIKDQLTAGIPPTVLANLTLKQMDGNPETKATVTSIVMNQPIEEIVKLDAELAAEPMRSQFGEFFGVLRARISADSPAT